jgi:cytochrome P450
LTIQYPTLYHVLRETLRRHTIVPTMLREAKTDLAIPGVKERRRAGCKPSKIRRGSVLRYLPVRGNMRRSIWKQPHRFDPSRFAKPLTAEQKKNHHMFGLGPQSCPGRAMAITETILILKAFFMRFDLEYQGNHAADCRPEKCAADDSPNRGQCASTSGKWRISMRDTDGLMRSHRKWSQECTRAGNPV